MFQPSSTCVLDQLDPGRRVPSGYLCLSSSKQANTFVSRELGHHSSAFLDMDMKHVCVTCIRIKKANNDAIFIT